MKKTEVIQLYKGDIKPDNASLRDLVMVQGVRHYNWFIANKKDTDPDTLARAYVDKMIALCSRFVNNDIEAGKLATWNLCVLVGNTLNYSDIANYDTDGWELMVENNAVSAFELASRISNEEKVAYDGL